MGTNFYRRNILTKERKENIYNKIDEFSDYLKYDLEKSLYPNCDYDELNDFINEQENEIHICKRSCGWYINFDHNWGKYYQPTRESLTKFLSEPNTEIIDEYGEVYTLEEFWKEVDEWNSSSKRDGTELWTSKTYDEWEKSRDPNWKIYDCTSDRNKVKDLFNIDVPYGESDFISDGLRWAVFSNFS